MRDLSLHLLDIIQNSITAKASAITIFISADRSKDRLLIKIQDNGIGMDDAMRLKVTDPFVTTRTTRKIGLGIPLLLASARLAGGDVTVDSEKGKGTTITADFQISNIDRLPLGDIPETMVSLIVSEPEIRFVIVLDNGVQCIKLDTLEVKEKLGEVPITEYQVLMWIKEFIGEGVKKIFGGVLHEIDS